MWTRGDQRGGGDRSPSSDHVISSTIGGRAPADKEDCGPMSGAGQPLQTHHCPWRGDPLLDATVLRASARRRRD